MTKELAIKILCGDVLATNEQVDEAVKMAVEALKEEPTKRGRWEQVEVVHDRKDAKIQDWQQAKCSVCGRWNTTPFMYYLKLDNYCPHCGAKMDEVSDD